MATGLPRSIWALGLVSLLMDVSSEMIHGLMPVFLVTVLGAGMLTVGLIEGIGEATANIAKLSSSIVSDRSGRPTVCVRHWLMWAAFRGRPWQLC